MAEIFFDKPTDYLNFEFRLRKQRRPAYSLRAFARDLQMSPSNLCDFMKGRYGISEERARSISQILKWSPERREHFWDLIQSKHGGNSVEKKNAQTRVRARMKNLKGSSNLDQFHVVSDWQHMAFLCFVQMSAKPSTTESLANKLNMTVSETLPYLERLQRVGLLQCQTGRWKAADDRYHVGDEVPSEAIRHYHTQILELAKKAIESVSFEKRANVSVIFSVSNEQLPLLRQEIQETLLKIASQYTQKEPHDNVQVMTFQMFPLWEKESAT